MDKDFEVNFNTTRLLNSLEQPFHEANEIMFRQTQMEVRANKWQWPRETKRKRGEDVTSPRNIIDEGTFSDSHQHTRVDDTTHEHSFNTEYALAVVLGAKLANGTELPARNVFKEPVEKLPGTFEKLAKAALGRVQDS